MKSLMIKVFVLFVMFFGVQNVTARPSRVKRVSDAHLADLETRVALNDKLKGIAITMPVGGGLIDPKKIGRRRRSESPMLEAMFNTEEDSEESDALSPEELLYIFKLGLRQLRSKENSY